MTDTTGGQNSGGAQFGGQSGDQGGGQGGGQVADTLAGLQSAAQNAAVQFNERSQAARDWASMQTDVARQTVVERPFVSAGAAFAAGVVFGVLLARR